NTKATFGYHRAEVIGALFNGLVLLIVSFFIIKEAITRFFKPEGIQTDIMMLIAVGGLFINLLSLKILHQDKSRNINVRGAWLHVMSDTLGSVGVVVSGLLIYLFDWTMADPIVSIVIASLISYSAVHLIFDTLKVLMEHAPSHIDINDVSEEILSIPLVLKIHDLHIWSITAGKDALSVHVVAEEGADFNQLLHDIQHVLTINFGIEHATVQIENKCPSRQKY
ncbi:MAG: cation transporter, partial [Myxococcales bacterium]|nr:cation transporter [Myxococcales bacterium]